MNSSDFQNPPPFLEKEIRRAFLVLIALSLLVALLAISLGIARLIVPHTNEPPIESEEVSTPDDTEVSADPTEVLLGETADAGMAYIDRMIFVGESTTAHLRARGVLSDGTDTKQVWLDESGTKRLSSAITSELIIYPETGEHLTIAAACALEQPDYIVLSFGLNGLQSFISNKASYVNNYAKLIRAIQSASPNTRIILQTVYPICDEGNFAESLDTLNANILTVSSWLPEIAASFENVRVVDTASVLRGADNALLPSYDNGDGQHLTASAYEEILTYLRTHAWE